MPQPYQSRYVKGQEVSIADRSELEEFRRTWSYHHPLLPEQLECASQRAIIEDVGFYHGGDVLYQLFGVPGLWHEAVLHPAGSA